MVLSNKKLKQKLRAQLAESLAKSESQINQPNLKDSQTHQSFKSLLSSATQKPKLSKREKRRDKIPSLGGSPELENHENGVEDKESEKGSGGSEKNKKRKREKDGVEAKDLSEKKSSKNKKKKKQKKKKAAKEEEVVDRANGGSDEQALTEAIQTHNSKEDVSISTKVYVGGIPYYSTVDDIRSFFEGCGSITEIDCLKFPETGKFNGIAMISFRTEAAAKRALALDGSDMGGLSLKIQPYKAARDKRVSDFAPPILEGYNRIYVGNLSWDITEAELKKLFSDCSISSVRLGKDKETGDFRGFAHVDFADSLSLTMALKLDQKPLFGRPVRIRCAVPPKSVKPNSKSESSTSKQEAAVEFVHDGAKESNFASETTTGDTVAIDDGAGKVKRRTCYACGGKGHLSSLCPNKEAANVEHTAKEADDMAVDNADTSAFVVAVAKEEVDNISDGKLRRRTCYECGERGHLSSSCPKKQDADMVDLSKEGNGMKADELKTVAAVGKEAGSNVVSSVSGGKLKRSCYECGEKGHLSSLCPNKEAANVGRTAKEADDMAVDNADTLAFLVAVAKEEVDNISDGKLRRRTCYECGERGHLSSSCPKKQAADMVDLVKEVNGMKVEEHKTVAAVGKEAGGNVVSSISGGRLRRRTCYECGEKGHLSSLCPNKKEADVTNPGST